MLCSIIPCVHRKIDKITTCGRLTIQYTHTDTSNMSPMCRECPMRDADNWGLAYTGRGGGGGT